MGLFTTKKQSSSTMAKERLKFVLVHDRTDITIDMMEKMKNDIIEVISRYVRIDVSEVLIDITQEGMEQKLTAEIPIQRSSSNR